MRQVPGLSEPAAFESVLAQALKDAGTAPVPVRTRTSSLGAGRLYSGATANVNAVPFMSVEMTLPENTNPKWSCDDSHLTPTSEVDAVRETLEETEFKLRETQEQLTAANTELKVMRMKSDLKLKLMSAKRHLRFRDETEEDAEYLLGLRIRLSEAKLRGELPKCIGYLKTEEDAERLSAKLISFKEEVGLTKKKCQMIAEDDEAEEGALIAEAEAKGDLTSIKADLRVIFPASRQRSDTAEDKEAATGLLLAMREGGSVRSSRADTAEDDEAEEGALIAKTESVRWIQENF